MCGRNLSVRRVWERHARQMLILAVRFLWGPVGGIRLIKTEESFKKGGAMIRRLRIAPGRRSFLFPLGPDLPGEDSNEEVSVLRSFLYRRSCRRQ